MGKKLRFTSYPILSVASAHPDIVNIIWENIVFRFFCTQLWYNINIWHFALTIWPHSCLSEKHFGVLSNVSDVGTVSTDDFFLGELHSQIFFGMIVFTRSTYFPLFCYIIRQCQTMYERGYYKNKIPIIFHWQNLLRQQNCFLKVKLSLVFIRRYINWFN